MASSDDKTRRERSPRAPNAEITRDAGGTDNRDDKSFRFISLFAKNQYAVHGYIRALVPNRADAEDIMQEVSYTLWNKWHTFDPETDFIRWACAVAFIEILRYRRKSAKDRLWFNEPLMELLAADFRRNADMHSARLDALVTCLEKLNPQDRRLVEVRYRQGGSVQRMADELGKPLSTIYKMLNRIRTSLRRCIDHSLATQSHPTQPQS